MKLLATGLFFGGGAALATLLGWLIHLTPNPAGVYGLLATLVVLLYAILWLLDDPISEYALNGDRATYTALLVATGGAIVISILAIWGAVQ